MSMINKVIRPILMAHNTNSITHIQFSTFIAYILRKKCLSLTLLRYQRLPRPLDLLPQSYLKSGSRLILTSMQNSPQSQSTRLVLRSGKKPRIHSNILWIQGLRGSVYIYTYLSASIKRLYAFPAIFIEVSLRITRERLWCILLFFLLSATNTNPV